MMNQLNGFPLNEPKIVEEVDEIDPNISEVDVSLTLVKDTRKYDNDSEQIIKTWKMVMT